MRAQTVGDKYFKLQGTTLEYCEAPIQCTRSRPKQYHDLGGTGSSKANMKMIDATVPTREFQKPNVKGLTSETNLLVVWKKAMNITASTKTKM